ncbi:hypothetical protein Bca4012_063658 [Brassica carinata]
MVIVLSVDSVSSTLSAAESIYRERCVQVQAHGSDEMEEEENCVFFLPHNPRSEVIESPVFVFMKGTGWCGRGADHYEPVIASPSQIISQEKVAFVL